MPTVPGERLVWSKGSPYHRQILGVETTQALDASGSTRNWDGQLLTVEVSSEIEAREKETGISYDLVNLKMIT